MTGQASSSVRIRVSAFGRSDRGRTRQSNQDNLLVVDLGSDRAETPRPGDDHALTVGPVEFELTDAGAVLMVADGMGGRAGGERASASAVAAVRRAMTDGADGRGPSDFANHLDRALAAANSAIHEESMGDDRFRGMGTTATLAGVHGQSVYVAQVGDSRAYLAREGSMARLTRDQSLVQDLIDMGVLSEEEAQSVPRNQILQAVGVAPKVDPVLTYHELRRGDVLLLCSDGLSGVVSDAEVQAAIAQAPDLGTLCDGLVELANERGGPDNITVLAARLDGDGLRRACADDVVVPRSYPPKQA
jgi:protein phosphatase